MLRKLTQTFGVSGRESAINEVITEFVKDYADKITTDGIDNLIVYKRGNGSNKKNIMVSMHKDEIGFMVMSIDSDGYIKVRNIGGINVATTVMNRIQFRNGTMGIVGFSKGLGKLEGGVLDMYVDIGAKSKEDAEKKVKVGDVACYTGDIVKLRNKRVASKAMDNRIGCYIGIKALMQIETPYHDMYFVFSSQEELGLRGATVASRIIKPDIGIAVDITGSYDTPESKDGNMKLGEGAAIKVMDRSVICDETVINTMVDISKKNKIKYQMDILPSGGTDAGAMNISNHGVRSGGISIPTRNGHGPNGMVDMKDVDACIKLLAEFAMTEIKI
ncbi:MAG: M20/M25/M40 family metallo-hydrolase [Clostridiales bacterium]|nr:M20/M25/M40 family metallo-hydrolase [Clostridiales bacterium]